MPLRAEDDDALSRWWDGKQITGDLFGLRPAAAEHGLTMTGRWRGIYFGILESENGSGNAFSQDIVFSAALDLGQALGWEALGGLTAFVEGRWRDAGPDWATRTISSRPTASSIPRAMPVGTGWRMVQLRTALRAVDLFLRRRMRSP